MTRVCFALLSVLTAVLSSCSSFTANDGGVSRKLQYMAHYAVYEVVVKKPPEDNRFVYERQPDFSSVPYNVRSDSYAAVGTAFAVSPDEAVTAFHVLNPASKSAVYDKYFLRRRAAGEQSADEVYEIETITRASNEMDFVFFTVKDSRFSCYFEIEKNFKEGDFVYSMGNAWGEGITMRSGAVLGTIPEGKNGERRLIKTSAPGNPGNSGGPLVNKKGKAIGVLTASRDSILYSVPFSEINKFSKNELDYSISLDYAYLILPNTARREFKYSVNLPLLHNEVSEIISNAFNKEYQNAVNEIFEKAPVYLYGEKNESIFENIPQANFPQINFVDKNDGEWKPGKLDVKAHRIDREKTLYAAEAGPFNIMHIYGINNASFSAGGVKNIIDTMLKVIPVNRTLNGKDGSYRIVSFGEPNETKEIRDNLGRLWIESKFLLSFDDMYFIAFILPLPGGPVMLTTFCTSSAAFVFEYDMSILLNYINIAYSAPFEKWNVFLQNGQALPDFLKDFSFDWNKNAKTIGIKTTSLNLKLDNKVLDWSPASELSVAYTWQKEKNNIYYGLRAIGFDKDGTGIESAAVFRVKDEWSFHIRRGNDSTWDDGASNDVVLRLNALKAGTNIIENQKAIFQGEL